jgi:hypothetical protein
MLPYACLTYGVYMDASGLPAFFTSAQVVPCACAVSLMSAEELANRCML